MMGMTVCRSSCGVTTPKTSYIERKPLHRQPIRAPREAARPFPGVQPRGRVLEYHMESSIQFYLRVIEQLAEDIPKAGTAKEALMRTKEDAIRRLAREMARLRVSGGVA